MTRPVESKVTRLSTPKTLEHGLPPYLASDEALIHMLNRYPADLFDANGQVSLRPSTKKVVPRRNASPATQDRKLQVTLRNVEHAHPGLWAEARGLLPETRARAGHPEARAS